MAQTMVKIEAVTFTKHDTKYNLTLVTVRNTGSVPATITRIYFYFPNGSYVYNDYSQNNVIDVKDTLVFALKLGPDFDNSETDISGADCVGRNPVVSDHHTKEWVESTGYKIKVVTDTGFITEGTFYSPAEKT
ncbi:MAG: hypothetical protein DRJ03_30245 [Chloroflexi bacterium]|nr:MAG: hypothetical protein DRJ03_30245 [Chloroflexota bacterium]